jgi:hypothetical protein
VFITTRKILLIKQRLRSRISIKNNGSSTGNNGINTATAINVYDIAKVKRCKKDIEQEFVLQRLNP